MFRFVALVSLLAVVFAGPAPRHSLVPLFPDGRIVGGVDASIEDYPYQISMKYSNSHRCGGSIVSDTVIVSAAHCVTGISASNTKITVGSTLKNGGDNLAVSQIVYHEQYDAYNIDYDISYLVLSQKLTYKDGVQPIALPIQGAEVATGAISIVTGWGTLSSGGSSPNILQAVEVPVTDQQKCISAYNGLGYKVTPQMICAGAANGGKDACQGDSGGPMVVNNTLVGIVSWGAGCAQAQYPGVYSRVAALRQWLAAKANV